jgi:hypothetical protein
MAAQTKPRAALSVDVTPRGVSPRLGLEFYRPVEWHDMDPTGWGLLIDLLAERGWCLPEKAHGLKSWPRIEQVFNQGNVYSVRQTINHVKIIADRGTTTAKAYTGSLVLQAA